MQQIDSSTLQSMRKMSPVKLYFPKHTIIFTQSLLHSVGASVFCSCCCYFSNIFRWKLQSFQRFSTIKFAVYSDSYQFHVLHASHFAIAFSYFAWVWYSFFFFSVASLLLLQLHTFWFGRFSSNHWLAKRKLPISDTFYKTRHDLFPLFTICKCAKYFPSTARKTSVRSEIIFCDAARKNTI